MVLVPPFPVMVAKLQTQTNPTFIMSVIIRLQNLPWSANALDIREFFKGLSIPEGGVHIVGGELGDAFIAFSTDEDARLAMRMTGTSLKGIQVTLLLSSRAEMQKVIEDARQRAMALQAFMAPPVIATPTQQPTASPVIQQPQPQPQPQVQPQPQAVPPPSQVPPPMMQHPTHTPYVMHGLPPSADSHQPIPPMPPHMPHTPPITMQQPMQALPKLSHIQEQVYNNMSNQRENNDSQGAMVPKEDKKEDKRLSTGSISASTSRRDSKGRDGRRRRSRTRSRTRSRSRDRDRDRHRRHRTRSRSRSRERSGRSHRRSSRSRERDRFRDKNRDRDRSGRESHRDRERERGGRIGRDRSDRTSLDSNKAIGTNEPQMKDLEVLGATGGIPGLGEIPSISMRGPLPSSLTEPIRNSPIQTPPGPPPVPAPVPVPVPIPNYAAGPPFNGGVPFPHQMPFSNMSVPPPIIQAPSHVEAPTDMELIAEDEGSLDQDGLSEGQPDISVPEPVTVKPSNDYMGGPGDGPMRVHGEYPPRFGAVPGDVPGPPQFANRGLVPPMRPPPEGFGFEEQPGNNFPTPMESGNGFNQEHFEPRNRADPPQRNWPPREGSPADASRFRGEREPRDMRGFRGEKEMMNRGERNQREGSDTREMREENEMHGNWGRQGHDEEFEPGWDGPNRQDGGKESSWNGRGRQGNFHPRNEREREGYGGRNEREGWEEQEGWGGRDGYPSRDQERYGDEGDYDESFTSRGYRGRGGRGWDRGRGWERGRGGRGGFNPRHGEFGEGHHEDGYMPRGGHGGFRGRGSSRWGGQFGEETSCVELRNVPVTASYRAIRELFQNIYVPNSSIKILGDTHGNRTDVAFIRFSQPRDAFRATKFSGKYLYDSKIEITLLSESKYDAEIDVKQLTGSRAYRGAPPEMEKNFMNESPCVYVTGLPMGCTDHNVAQVFDKYKIEDIVIERVRGTRQPSGGCFVRLNSFDEAQRAIAELAEATIDGSPLLIELCPVGAMAPAVRDRDLILGKIANDKMDKGQETKKPVSKEQPPSDEQPAELPLIKQSITADLLTDSVVVKRVPKDATEANVRDFFSDEGLVPERMHFCEAGTNGVREVYVMFPLIEDAKRALGKNEQQIGKMKVMVEMIAKPIVMNAMGLSFDPLELIKKGQKSGGLVGPQTNEKINISQVKVPVEDVDALPDEGGHDPMLNLDHPMEEGPMEMPYPNSFDGQPPFRGRMAGPFPGGRGYVPRGETRGMGRGMGGPGRGGMGDFGRVRGPLMKPPAAATTEDNIGTAIPPENFGKPGCVVALANLPYRCTTDDILDFLREFPTLRPEHIIRRYNEFNQPTADARVSFGSPQDAQRAIGSHNRRTMDNRLIFVSLVPK